MTPERAQELLDLKSSVLPHAKTIEVGSITDFMDDKEVFEINRLWQDLPGSCSFADTLQMVARLGTDFINDIAIGKRYEVVSSLGGTFNTIVTEWEPTIHRMVLKIDMPRNPDFHGHEITRSIMDIRKVL